jgi:3-hydroxyacyl-[acyl-carrier-protein] dehydratase
VKPGLSAATGGNGRGDLAADGSSANCLSFDEICRVLPHRPPFVLVDQVSHREPGRRIVCLKNVTGAESIFSSHFPASAVFPGAFLLEAMAQATLLMFHGVDRAEEERRKLPVLAAAKVRWSRPVRPGDQVILSAEVEKQMPGAALVRVEARVGMRRVAKAQLTVGRIALPE